MFLIQFISGISKCLATINQQKNLPNIYLTPSQVKFYILCISKHKYFDRFVFHFTCSSWAVCVQVSCFPYFCTLAECALYPLEDSCTSPQRSLPCSHRLPGCSAFQSCSLGWVLGCPFHWFTCSVRRSSLVTGSMYNKT